ncbi:hypothetical protein EGW08_015276, partial [Elysia chlorotica]
KLESVQHIQLENEKELRICRDRLALTDKLKYQVLQLQNEVLLTQEFHQKCQEKLHHANGMSKHRAEESYLINALRAEIKVLKDDNNRRSNLLEATQARLAEMEDKLKAKDEIITKIKDSFESAKSGHKAQLQVLEERCAGLVQANHNFEGQIMDLTGQLDQAMHRKMAAARRRIGQSTTTTTNLSEMASLDLGSIEANTEGKAKGGNGDSKTKSKTDGSGGKVSEGMSKSSLTKLDTAGGVTEQPGGMKGENGEDGRVGGGGSGETTSTEKKEKSETDQQAPAVGSVQSGAETLLDSGFPSRASYRQDSPSDASVASGLAQSLNTADSACWPKEN